MSEDFEYKVTTIKTSGYTRCGNVSTYWESEPKEIDMSQYIPIEWIEKFIDNDILSETVKILLNAWYWEKENEKTDEKHN